MDIFSAFSSKENLKQAFLYLKEETSGSSLPLDPILKPASIAISQLGDDFFEALETYLRQDKYRPDKADYVYAQKDNAGVRPVCVFSVVDRIVFQALLNPLILGNTIDSKLLNSCFCNRILGEGKYLKPYSEQWTNFCYSQIKAFDNGLVWRLEFDIHTYYENIHIDTLIKTLEENFQIHDVKLLAILKCQLKQWSEKPTMCGLPQGANASNVLANAYLNPFDLLLDDLKGKDNFEFFRYNDDVVIMAESADKINFIHEKAVLLLREYNLNLNEKSKLEKLKDTKSIKEMIFHNPYGHLNETSRQKIAKISKNISATLRNLRKGKDVKKNDVSNLKYCLRAGFGLGNSEMFDNLVAIIPNKPSLIFYISEYFGYYFSNEDKEFYLANKNIIHAKYESIWEMCRNKSLTQWTKFSLLKILSAPPFAREHKGFRGELNRIVADTNAQFLRPLAFFYKAYVRDMVRLENAMKNESIHAIDVGFTLDDIRRQIRNSKTETERAIYYYFVLYLKDTEEEGVIRSLVFDALGSESPEVQTMGIFLIKKLYRKSLPEIFIEDMRSGRMPKTIGDKPITIETPEKDTLNISLEGRTLGELSRIYFKLPTSEKASPEQKTDELLTNDGKIAQDKFPQFIGMAPLKVEIEGDVKKDIAVIAAHLKQGEKPPSQNKNYPKSMYLITDRLAVGKTIFLVIDKHFDTPIRCEVKSGGGFSYMKKLYNIAYVGNAPGTKVVYDPVTADSINNKLFLRPQVAECMKTHGLDKPTLVIKSEEIMVLKNETPVKTGLINNVVPTEHRSLYTDKTN
jgi:hypothetical protein